jgi:hypothetical protein
MNEISLSDIRASSTLCRGLFKNVVDSSCCIDQINGMIEQRTGYDVEGIALS